MCACRSVYIYILGVQVSTGGGGEGEHCRKEHTLHTEVFGDLAMHREERRHGARP